MRIPTPFALDSRLIRVREVIPDLDGGLRGADETASGRARAAVSLILRAGREIEVLLIRRAEADGDPWSGHMALPGGRWDPVDGSLLHTAMRETAEETGVVLDAVGIPLGRLDPLVPATRRLPPISIFPFVFAVPDGTSARAASLEVDETLWVPASTLFHPDAAGRVEISFGAETRTFPCIRVEDRVIWGLTYRILQDFLAKIETGSPGILASARGVRGLNLPRDLSRP